MVNLQSFVTGRQVRPQFRRARRDIPPLRPRLLRAVEDEGRRVLPEDHMLPASPLPTAGLLLQVLQQMVRPGPPGSGRRDGHGQGNGRSVQGQGGRGCPRRHGQSALTIGEY